MNAEPSMRGLFLVGLAVILAAAVSLFGRCRSGPPPSPRPPASVTAVATVAVTVATTTVIGPTQGPQMPVSGRGGLLP